MNNHVRKRFLFAILSLTLIGHLTIAAKVQAQLPDPDGKPADMFIVFSLDIPNVCFSIWRQHNHSGAI